MDIVTELMNADAAPRPGVKLRIDVLYGDQPDVQDAIRIARLEKRLSYRRIADVLSRGDEQISPNAVQNWLRAQGIS
jgi:hypothetical protein